MEYKKNDLLTVTIEDMGHDGEGIGKVDGYTVFVKDTVIGDKVQAKIMKAKKNYGYARLVEIMEPSKDRVEPRCAYARQCGGCQIQALSYEKQLAYKQQKIENNLIRIGGFQKEEIPMQPIIGMEDPYHYRNKAQFPVGCDKEGHLIAGFYAGRTHTIISNRKCYLGVEVNEQILNLVLAHMEAYDIPAYDEMTGKGLVRHVLIRYGFQSKEIMVCPGSGRSDRKTSRDSGDDQYFSEYQQGKDERDSGEKRETFMGQGIYHRYHRTDRLSDLPAVFLPGQSGADTETLRKSPGICRSGRK